MLMEIGGYDGKHFIVPKMAGRCFLCRKRVSSLIKLTILFCRSWLISP